jgi:ABC-2 type transport system ATP-binding protein
MTTPPDSVSATAPIAAQGSPAPVELSGVSRWYGNVVAVNDVSFSLEPGVTGLLGPNGAGKSTLLHLIAGLLAPSAGSVSIGGRPAFADPQVYRDIGLVPERESVYPFLTGREFVEANAKLQGLSDPAAAAQRAIAEVDLIEAQDRALGGYSKGMRQRAKVAAAFVHDPKILLLDEPFNGMDPRQRLHTMGFLRRLAEEGRTILFSSHILEEVEKVADRVLVVIAGRLAASGDFRAIRRLMTDRPHTFTLRSSNDRRLAAQLLVEPFVTGVTLDDGLLVARAADYGAFSRSVAARAREADVTLYEVLPTDESLESVFSYLVRG